MENLPLGYVLHSMLMGNASGGVKKSSVLNVLTSKFVKILSSRPSIFNINLPSYHRWHVPDRATYFHTPMCAYEWVYVSMPVVRSHVGDDIFYWTENPYQIVRWWYFALQNQQVNETSESCSQLRSSMSSGNCCCDDKISIFMYVLCTYTRLTRARIWKWGPYMLVSNFFIIAYVYREIRTDI